MLATKAPFPQYFDIDGSPLDAGSIYFGTAGANPETTPIQIYWDAAGTIPAVQPIRTVNGYTARAGSPAILYAAGDYSLTVRGKTGGLVYYAANSAQFGNDSQFLGGLANFSDSADTAHGDALVALKRTQVATVASTLHLWHEAQIVNVKSDGGCKMDGTTDDTAALQAIADNLAAFQNLQITAHKLTKAVVFFPDGNLKLTSEIRWRGFVALIGTGTAYTGGSCIRQTVAGKDIFRFYGSANDARSLGVCVEGLNFEFDDALATSTGWALYFPKLNDIGGGVLASNSHYIRRNRFGGWNAKGRGIKALISNDMEISGNVFDVCPGAAVELGDAADVASVCTDVRIFGNGFYYCQTGIGLRNVAGVTIGGSNSFFVQYDSSWTAIDMTAGGAAIVPGRVSNVTITGNEFSGCYSGYRIDGSARAIIIGDNAYADCRDYLLRVEGSTDVSGLQWLGGSARLNPAYPQPAVIYSPNASIVGSTIADLQVDANGNTGVVAIAAERSGPVSCIGAGVTWRNNIVNNNSGTAGAHGHLLPCTARELALENQHNFGSAYPTTGPIFNLSTIAFGDFLTLEIAWEVTVTKAGTNVGTKTGVTRVSLARRNGTFKQSIADILSIGDDDNGSGGTQIPTVAWSVANATPAYIGVTITCAIASPDSIVVRAKAHSFRASGAVQIKCA